MNADQPGAQRPETERPDAARPDAERPGAERLRPDPQRQGQSTDSRLISVHEGPLEMLTAGLQHGVLLGLDLGTRTIGVAASDLRRQIATPVQTLPKAKFTADAGRLIALAKGRGAVGFVVGLPRNMDGSEGPRAQSARAFARGLARAAALPVALWDERLSTVAVERTLLDADATRKRRAEVVDRMAAAFILQGALDRLNWAAAQAEAQAGGRDD